ncbi:MAG: STAS domain-containing protein [Parasporobacterium sp.]|nr:STAS domain-containing protein [Parasporobacterium sp.]
MTINKVEENGKITLQIEGWLDVETTPELHAYMENLPASEELYFDFSNLEYISSAGVREVVQAYRRQKAAEGSFAVLNVNPDVMDVFSMTGLNKKMDIREKEA